MRRRPAACAVDPPAAAPRQAAAPGEAAASSATSHGTVQCTRTERPLRSRGSDASGRLQRERAPGEKFVHAVRTVVLALSVTCAEMVRCHNTVRLYTYSRLYLLNTDCGAFRTGTIPYGFIMDVIKREEAKRVAKGA